MKQTNFCNKIQKTARGLLLLLLFLAAPLAQAQNLRLLKITAEGVGTAQLGISLDLQGNVYRLFSLDENQHWYFISIQDLQKPHPIVTAKIKGIFEKNVVTAVGNFKSNQEIEVKIGFLKNALADSEVRRIWFPIRILYNNRLQRYEVWDLRKNKVVTEAKALIHHALLLKVGIDDFQSQ